MRARPHALGVACALAVSALACGQPSAPKPEAPPQEQAQPPLEQANTQAPTQAPTQEPTQAPSAAQSPAQAAPAAEAQPTPEHAATGSQPSIANDAPPAAPRAEETAPVAAPAPGDCKTERTGIERDLRKARRCRANDECAMVNVHYAFGPCGIGARKDAPLAELRERATRYAERCNPPVVRVRCAHQTGALCTKGVCTLASPRELEAAGAEPSQLGY